MILVEVVVAGAGLFVVGWFIIGVADLVAVVVVVCWEIM